jgi:hypothetical protein
MHPIEHLRFLARSNDPSPDWLVPEAAEALRALAGDRSDLVMASRKLLERQPFCGPLWWLCGRVLLAPDPRRAVDAALAEYDRDDTPLQVSMALDPAGQLDDLDAIDDEPPLLIECLMIGPSGVVVAVPDPAVARVGGAHERGAPVWAVGGVGRVVPARIHDAVTALVDHPASADRWSRLPEVEVVPAAWIDGVIGPAGFEVAQAALLRPDVPFVPELLPRR